MKIMEGITISICPTFKDKLYVIKTFQLILLRIIQPDLNLISLHKSTISIRQKVLWPQNSILICLKVRVGNNLLKLVKWIKK